MKKILFSVTNDLNSDQRMWRICASLQAAGYHVQLVGRQLPDSRVLPQRAYAQHRMVLFFNKGPMFYLEYNLRLFLYALGSKVAIYSAVDLDTLPAMWLAARLRNCPMVYDAHEIFTEVPELAPGGLKQRLWKTLERLLLPKIRHAYTVNHSLATWYKKQYGIQMEVVRNMPEAREPLVIADAEFILYQGALNAGRGLEALIEAAPSLPLPVYIAGKGDLADWLTAAVRERGLGDKVKLLGQLDPEALQQLTARAWLGINLLESQSLNYYYSLANKFFDYVQAGIPQLCADFPEYAHMNSAFEVAVLSSSHETSTWLPLVDALWKDQERYAYLKSNCLKAAREWTWESEKKTLLAFYASVFS